MWCCGETAVMTQVAVKTTWMNCCWNSCFHNKTMQTTPVLISRIYLMFSVRPCLGTNSLPFVFSWTAKFYACKLDFSKLYIYKILTLNLRFPKGDMERLRDALQLPANYICSQGTIATGMEALMILLRRLAYPNRWSDLVPVFGRTVSELSLIFNKVKLLLCPFVFPVEVAYRSCLYSPFILPFLNLTRGVESLTVHFVLFAWVLFVLDYEVKLREKFNSSYSLE